MYIYIIIYIYIYIYTLILCIVNHSGRFQNSTHFVLAITTINNNKLIIFFYLFVEMLQTYSQLKLSLFGIWYVLYCNNYFILAITTP